jgi:hypothetical protein
LPAAGPEKELEKDHLSQRKRSARPRPVELTAGEEGEEQAVVESVDKQRREKRRTGKSPADAQLRAERQQARVLRKAESRASRAETIPGEKDEVAPPLDETLGGKEREDLPAPDDGEEVDAVAIEDDFLDQEDSTRDGDAQSPAVPRQLPESLEIRLYAGTAAEGDILYDALKTAFQAAGVTIQTEPGDEADLVVHFGQATSPHLLCGRIATVFVAKEQGRASDETAAAAAGAENGIFLSLPFLVERYGRARLLNDEGHLTRDGAAVLAAALREQILHRRSKSLSCNPTPEHRAADFAAALSLGERPSELLKVLTWVDDAPPSSIRVSLNPKSVECFLDGNVCLSSKGDIEPLPFYFPFDWQNAVSGRAAESLLYGLDFATHVLVYWQLKATGASSQNLTAIAAAAKERGITAASLLGAAGAVILDCLSARNALPENAWQLPLLQRRARACELFLLCCKIAATRRIRFNDSACREVFSGLLDILERLRSAIFADIDSSRSVAHAAVLIGLALPLKKTTYGQLLIGETLNALRSIHLNRGMSSDGVWREGFDQHSSVFSVLRVLAVDLKGFQGAERSVLAETNVKLARFLDWLLGVDGSAPPIGEVPPMNYRKLARPARILLKSAAASANTRALARGGDSSLLLREGGYFFSRADASSGAAPSRLVMQARPAPAGGPSLCLIVDSDPVLIGGGTHSRKAPPEARRASREEPSVHNTIRMNDLSYAQADDRGPEAIFLEAAWEGENWSAAKLINAAFAQAQMARTVIHLKGLSGLLVIDQLTSRAGPAKFEQFWQLAPRILTDDSAGAQFRIGCPRGGVLTATFDRAAPAHFIPATKRGLAWTSINKRDAVPNPHLSRSVVAQTALMGSLFRWQPKAAESELLLEPENGGWNALITSGNARLRFVFNDGQLTLVE